MFVGNMEAAERPEQLSCTQAEGELHLPSLSFRSSSKMNML
jgi:hypothetical protein